MRRITPEKREVVPDARFSSVIVSSFINRIMGRGKKSTATTLVYDSMDLIAERTGKNPMEVLDQAVKNVGPSMEVRPRRVGGATYQVPMDVAPLRRFTLAMRWIIDASRARSGKTFSEKFASEVMDAASNQGAAIRKRDETHKMAEANRAFSHYRM